MPALKGLHARLQSNPPWLAMYQANLKLAGEIASRVHLIHVTREKTMLKIARIPPQTIKPSAEGRSAPLTIKTEDAFGLGRSLYFYAGRAYRVFGNVAMAFLESHFDAGTTGSATPFDTGALYNGTIHWGPPNRHPVILKQFVRDSIVSLAGWRKAFQDFLAAYFEDPFDYWLKPPKMPDVDGILLHPKNDLQAWTFEIRVDREQDTCRRIAWSYTKSFAESLDEAIRKDEIPPFGAFQTPLSLFLQGGPPLSPTGVDEACAAMEEWVRGECS